MRLHLFFLLLVISSCNPVEYRFELPFPDSSDLGHSLNLWGTYYNLGEVKSSENGFPLRGMKNQKLGPILSHRNWCNAAMEGSIRVDGVTYNYAGQTQEYKVSCKKFWKYNTSKTKFKIAKGRFGDGVHNYILVPFRTIAVDPNKIKYGTVVFIPDAVGVKIKTSSGEMAFHDGYFFAGDTGGAIKNDHIDVFIGATNSPQRDNPFDFVRSSSKFKFSAYVVKNRKIINYLKALHLLMIKNRG